MERKLKKDIKIGDRVRVSGEVYYGDRWYGVDSYGIVEDIRTRSMLILIDMIDGDWGATVIVNKRYIHPIEE